MKRVSLLGSLASVLLTVGAVALLTTTMAAAVAAQGTHKGNFYTKADVELIIKRVEERSDAFRQVVDRSLDRSALDGTNREDNINQQVNHRAACARAGDPGIRVSTVRARQTCRYRRRRRPLHAHY